MGLYQQRSFRVLAAAFCSIGILGIADRTPTMWALLTLGGVLSAALLPAMLANPSLVPPKTLPPARLSR